MLITDKTTLLRYAEENRIWQGIPAIEVTEKGRIFSAFYSGNTYEWFGNYVVVLASDDGGERFETVAVLDDGDDVRCFDPCLWIDPLKRLWLIWAYQAKDGKDTGVYASICENPDAEALIWGEKFFVGKNVMMNKPTVLSTGEWLFPIAMWRKGVYVHPGVEYSEKGSSFVYKSVDNGRTFSVLGGARVPDSLYDEHMILERKDGVLATYTRTNYGIAVSYSYDRGKTWTEGKDSGIKGPSSRFHIRRLKSGRVLLINHYQFTGRSHLTALLSEDEGRTWGYALLLDERSNISYPDLKETEDGYLHITYDRERGGFRKCLEEAYADAREILYARITEADIMAGKLVSEKSCLKRVISKLGKYAREQENPYGIPSLYTDMELASRLWKDCGEDAVGRIFDYYPVQCVNMHEFESVRMDGLIEKWKSAPEENLQVLKEIVALARAVGASEYYMMHQFKKHTGTTVGEYRKAMRLREAKKALLDGKDSIAQIALDCGFENAGYFTEVFKREEGCTPSQYRENLKRRGV